MVCVPIKTNPPFQKISSVILSEIDNVKKVALITTATIEHDLKSGYFFPYVFRRYQSGDVTWIWFPFVLLRCAASSQLRNSSVFTHTHSESSAATSSATRKYGNFPEQLGGNEQNSINVSKRCTVSPDFYFSMKPWIYCFISFNLMILLVLSFYGEKPLIFCL